MTQISSVVLTLPTQSPSTLPMLSLPGVHATQYTANLTQLTNQRQLRI